MTWHPMTEYPPRKMLLLDAAPVDDPDEYRPLTGYRAADGLWYSNLDGREIFPQRWADAIPA